MKLFAIAPTMIIFVIFFIRLLIIPILVEIFAPPTIQVTGFLALLVSIFITLTSSARSLPAYESICFVISQTDAWALCEQEKASFI